jgi:Methyltransferase domain
LVNVHIHQFQPGGAVVDAAALAQFQEQWATYRKLVEGDCLAHREVSGILRETLNDVFTSPFCFLDIACGDGSTMKAALRGTQVRHYHGIDLSQAALDLAAANLAGLPFEVDLDHRDFVEAMKRRPEHADAFVAIFARRVLIPCRDHPLFYEPAAANSLLPAAALSEAWVGTQKQAFRSNQRGVVRPASNGQLLTRRVPAKTPAVVAKALSQLPQGTPLGTGRQLRGWRGRKGGEFAAKNNQSRYHENDY